MSVKSAETRKSNPKRKLSSQNSDASNEVNGNGNFNSVHASSFISSHTNISQSDSQNGSTNNDVSSDNNQNQPSALPEEDHSEDATDSTEADRSGKKEQPNGEENTVPRSDNNSAADISAKRQQQNGNSDSTASHQGPSDVTPIIEPTTKGTETLSSSSHPASSSGTAAQTIDDDQKFSCNELLEDRQHEHEYSQNSIDSFQSDAEKSILMSDSHESEDATYDETSVRSFIQNRFVSTCDEFSINSTSPSMIDGIYKQTISNHKAVQIWKRENGRYHLDRRALKKIFGRDEVVNKPVAIYSIAGECRQGKSFLLNLLLQYLRSEKCDSWHHNEEKLFQGGFDFRGGQYRCTEGIWIWDEPFPLKTESGEVVLFLMDTQGTFYREDLVKGCSVSFALSTMISSLQLYNIGRQIQESDIEMLEIFTECGRKGSKARREKLGKMFQNLFFVVRDWHDPEYQYGLDGGRKIIDDVLAVHDNQRDLKSVRRNIHKTFEKVECFLMPQPGNKVEVRSADNEELTMKDINEEFLEEVTNLASSLFDRTPPLMSVSGQPINAGSLIDVIAGFAEIFESGKVPKPSTIMEASSRIAMSMLIESCTDDYVNNMAETFQDGYLDEEELKSTHKMHKISAMQKFDDIPKLRKSSFVVMFRRQLNKLIDGNFAYFEKQNSAIKDEEDCFIMKTVNDLEEQYCQAMEKVFFRGGLESLSFDQYQHKHFTSALAALTSLLSNRQCETIRQLETTLSSKLEEWHKRYHVIWSAHKTIEEAHILTAIFTANNEYMLRMDQVCYGWGLDEESFSQAHHDACCEVINDMNASLVAKGNDLQSCFYREMKATLDNHLDEHCRSYSAMNLSFLKYHESTRLLLLAEIKNLYKETMAKSCAYSYLAEDCLIKAHDDATMFVRQHVQNSAAQMQVQLLQSDNTDLDNFMNQTFIDFKEKNKLWLKDIENKMDIKAKEAKDLYLKSMEASKGKFLPTQILNDQHANAIKNAMEAFDSNDFKIVAATWKNKRDHLNKELEGYMERCFKDNETNKGALEKKLSDTVALAGNVYVMLMFEKCNCRFQNSEAFEKNHTNASAKAVHDLGSEEFSLLTSLQAQKTKAHNLINQLKEQFEGLNQIFQRLDETSQNHAYLNVKTYYEQLMAEISKYADGEGSEMRQIEEESRRIFLELSTNGKQKVDLNFYDARMESLLKLSAKAKKSFEEEKKIKKMKQDQMDLIQTAKKVYAENMKRACGEEIIKTENGIEESHKNAVEATIQFFISQSQQLGIQVNDEIPKKINEETTLLKPIFDIFITNNIKELNDTKILETKLQIVDTFVKSVAESCNGRFHDDETFNEIQDAALSNALGLLDSKLPNLQLDEKDRVRKEVMQEIRQKSQQYKHYNVTNGRVETSLKLEMIHKVKEAYKSIMKQKCRTRYIAAKELQQFDQESVGYAFNAVANIEEEVGKRFTENEKEKAKAILQKRFQKISQENDKLKQELEQKLDKDFKRSRDTYEADMLKNCTVKYLEPGEFKAVHAEAKRKAFQVLNDEDFSSIALLRDAAKTDLEIAMDQMKATYEKDNETNRVSLEKEIGLYLSEAKKRYKESMEKVCGDDYNNASSLDKQHKKSEKLVRKYLEDVEKSKGKMFAKQKVTVLLEEKFETYKTKNNNLKKAIAEEYEIKASTALQCYNDYMDEQTLQSIDEKDLERFHLEQRTRALQVFDDMPLRIETCKALKEKLRKELTTLRKHFIEKNKESKQRDEEKTNQTLEDIKTKYMVTMQQLCEGKYIELDLLHSIHNRVKELLKPQFFSERDGQQNTSQVKCDLILESSFKTVKADNEKMKSLVGNRGLTNPQFAAFVVVERTNHCLL
ncbi:uncharacterized protein LOC143452043 [Clavelina lepadiformis]|uniref:uncharacterized protein LOC143452043 n=1 Tax=Clavelina lepadiformis TaxID=159417 RepID=UPI00404365C0